MTKTGQGVIPSVCHAPSLGFELAQEVLLAVDVKKVRPNLLIWLTRFGRISQFNGSQYPVFHECPQARPRGDARIIAYAPPTDGRLCPTFSGSFHDGCPPQLQVERARQANQRTQRTTDTGERPTVHLTYPSWSNSALTSAHSTMRTCAPCLRR